MANRQDAVVLTPENCIEYAVYYTKRISRDDHALQDLSLLEALTLMVQSGRFTVSNSWLAGPRQRDMVLADRLYKMLSSPQATTEADVALVMFNQVVRQASSNTVRDIGRQLREATLGGRRRDKEPLW